MASSLDDLYPVFAELQRERRQNNPDSRLGTVPIPREFVGTLAELALGVLPGSGDVMAAQDSGRYGRNMLQALGQGDYGRAASSGLMSLASGLGALPMVPHLLAIFAGPAAKTANKLTLKQAQEMAAKGADNEAIRKATGWFRGPDEMWRFEIPDEGARYLPAASEASMPSRTKLAADYFELKGIPRIKFATGQYPDLDKEALMWADSQLAAAREGAQGAPISTVLKHDALYEAYPELADTPVLRETLSGVGGSYKDGRITYGGAIGGDDRSVLLHELQHAVQDREGFARGGAPGTVMNEVYPRMAEINQLLPKAKGKEYDRLMAEMRDLIMKAEDPRSLYHRLAGEVEARAVQDRAVMSTAERAETPPYASQGIPFEDMIVLRRDRR